MADDTAEYSNDWDQLEVFDTHTSGPGPSLLGPLWTVRCDYGYHAGVWSAVDANRVKRAHQASHRPSDG